MEEKTDIPDPLILQIFQVLQVVLFVLILFEQRNLYNNLITKEYFISHLANKKRIKQEMLTKPVTF